MSQKRPEKKSSSPFGQSRPDTEKTEELKGKENLAFTPEKFVRSDSKTGEAEVPPVIIKGGSLDVEFQRRPFNDASTLNPVVLAIGPLTGLGHVGRITLVEYRHKQTKEVIASLPRPANLPHEDCLILVWDDQ